MKVERMGNQIGPLATEKLVLEALKSSDAVCQYIEYMYFFSDIYFSEVGDCRLLIMELAGPSLGIMRDKVQNHYFPYETVLKLGIKV